jgi:hypothetical protein
MRSKLKASILKIKNPSLKLTKVDLEKSFTAQQPLS